MKNIFFSLLIIGFVLTFQAQIIKAQDEDAQKSAELQSLRSRIKDVESNIQSARVEADQLYLELQQNEAAAAKVSGKLQEVDDDIKTSVKSLAELNVKKSSAQASLLEEREALKKQIRAAYQTGKNDYIKLLLNQEDPARVGRMLVYYDYFNKARTKRINLVTEKLEEISFIEQDIRAEKELLDNLRSVQLAKLEEYTSHRKSRKKIIGRLENYIEEQDRQLQILQRNEQELAELINRLREDETIVQTFEDIPPFDLLKGKLEWPVEGKLASRFGATRKGGKLKWHGVTIEATSGNDVEAISPGKVIFADWFRNMGLLIIIDHGDGFMSLYGHNERLLKKEGDWVSAREVIAKVGDTGGQQQANLYFEIRHGGDPLDPGLWCKL